MRQRLDQRLVRILEAGIFADHGDRHLALGVVDSIGDFLPAFHAWLRRGIDAKGGQDFRIQTLFVIGHRHIVDVCHIQSLDNGRFPHITKQRELSALFLGNGSVSAHEQNVGRDTDGAQFLYRMLRRLGLQFAGGRYVRHQCEMDIDRLPARQVVAKLADRFEERHRLDIANCAADFAKHEIEVLIAFDVRSS